MHHRVGSIFWLIFGVYTAITAYRLGIGLFRQPGPGFIFFLVSLTLIILSIIDLFIGKPKAIRGEKSEPVWLGFQWQKVILVLSGLLAYAYLFDKLGFLLSTFLLMIFLFKAVEGTKWWSSILISLITILISYCIFNLFLKVPFPKGFLGL